MRRLGLRRLLRLGILGLPGLGLACTHMPSADRTPPNPMQLLPHSPVDYPMSMSPAIQPRMSPDPAVVPSATREQLPMTLDAVLRLAGEQNPQVMIAQAKVAAACAEKDAAAQHWIPEIYLGTGYFRHAGGIQLQEGPLITSSAGAY